MDRAEVYGPLKKISFSLIGETMYSQSQLLQWSTEKMDAIRTCGRYIRIAELDKMDDKDLTCLRNRR